MTCWSRTTRSRRSCVRVRPTRPWAASATSCSINGDTAVVDEASVGEVVRMYLVNTANTRIFKFGIAGARMKLVGGDSGRLRTRSRSWTTCSSHRRNVRSSTSSSTPRATHASSIALPTTSMTSARSRVSGAVDRETPQRRSTRCARIPSYVPCAARSTTSSSVRPTRPWRSGPRCRCSTTSGSETGRSPITRARCTRTSRPRSRRHAPSAA